MTFISHGQRIFFGVISAAALLVAVLGLFMPQVLAALFSWLTLPPLHARFVGAIYLFGAIYTGLCALARQHSEVRHAALLIAIWTGMLGILSLLNLSAFDFSQPPAPIWIASYTIYPLIALWFVWQDRRHAGERAAGEPLPNWARYFLMAQGALIALLALGLLLMPVALANVWPWPITPFLAQTYAGPMLAYGIGSLLFGRMQSLTEIRPAIPAMLAFTVSVVIASMIHLNLFSFVQLPDVLWFAFFGIASIFLALLTLRVLPATRR